MSSSRFLVRGILCLAIVAGIASAQSVAILPGSQGTSTTVPVYTADPFGPQTTISGVPEGVYDILPKPDATKYYLIANAPGTPITVVNQSFGNPRQIATAISAVPTVARLSPDGKRLVVVAGTAAYVIDTATDSILNIGGYAITGTPVDLTFSQDARFAFILSANGSSAIVTPIDLSFLSVGTKLTITTSGTVTGIAVAPNGLLYVSATNALIEVNPRTVAKTANGTIQVNGTPGRVSFTSDGRYAIALNQTPQTGAAITFDLTTHTSNLVSAANLQGAVLDRILIASPQRIFAYSSQNHTLYELSLAGGITQTALRNAIPATAVNSFAVSDETTAKSIYLTAQSGGNLNFYKLDLASNALLNQTTITADTGHIVKWAGVSPTSGASSIQGFNTTQTVSQSSTSLPLVVRVVDAQGRPVFGALVTYSAPSGITLSSATAFTNSNGFAQIYATVGTTPGAVQIQATTQNVVTPIAFNITVPGEGGGPCLSGCTASNIKIVGGTGQIISEQQIAHELMMVEVDDANGNPLANQKVSFSVTQGSGTIQCSGIGDQFPYVPTGTCSSDGLTVTANTDQNGRAGVKYLSTSIFGQSFAPTVVTAASGVGSVNFVITTVLVARPNGGGQASLPVAYILKPTQGADGLRVLTGAAGATIPDAIEVQVVAADGPQSGQPIPNVALNVQGSGDAATTPSAHCAGGAVLTDSEGVASCDLVMGGVLTASPVALTVNVGSAIQTPLVAIVVTQGPPSKIQILQGNNQSGKAGQQIVLRAKVTDQGGNPTTSVPVSWQVTQGSATLGGSSTQTNAVGDAQTTVTLGGSPGNVLVKLTAGSGANTATATFTLTVNITIGGVAAVSGGGQTAVTGQAFTNPLVVKVTDNSQQPVQGAQVTYSVTSGAATIGTATVTTDAQGQASTTVTAGSTAGPITITATSGGSSTQFTLTARLPGPNITTASFRNGASGAAGLTPCGIAIVSGSGLAASVRGTDQANPFVGPLPYTLDGVSLDVNGVPAPIFWVSNTQQGGEAAAFQTPCEVTPGSASVVVRVNGTSTTVSEVSVTKYQPGVFTTMGSDNVPYAVALHADGSYVTQSNPAQRGEQLKLFLTGLGSVTPSTATNRAGTGDQMVMGAVTVGLNNAGVPVIGSEYLPGAIGIYVVTFQVPQDTQPGTQRPVGFIISDPGDPAAQAIYANGSFIPIS